MKITILLLILFLAYIIRLAHGGFQSNLNKRNKLILRLKADERKEEALEELELEKNLEKEKPCVKPEYIAKHESKKIKCFGSKSQEEIFRKMTFGKSVSFKWFMHESISRDRAFVDREGMLTILEAIPSDSGEFECHATIFIEQPGHPTERKTKRFKRNILVAVLPKYSTLTDISHPMRDCASHANKIKTMLETEQEIIDRRNQIENKRVEDKLENPECFNDFLKFTIHTVPQGHGIQEFTKEVWQKKVSVGETQGRNHIKYLIASLKEKQLSKLFRDAEIMDVPRFSISCPPGYYPNMVFACVPCMPGTFSTKGQQCLPCPRGYFQSKYASKSCAECPDGAPLSYKGASTEDECYSMLTEPPLYAPVSCAYWEEDVEYTLNPFANTQTMVQAADRSIREDFEESDLISRHKRDASNSASFDQSTAWRNPRLVRKRRDDFAKKLQGLINDLHVVGEEADQLQNEMQKIDKPTPKPVIVVTEVHSKTPEKIKSIEKSVEQKKSHKKKVNVATPAKASPKKLASKWRVVHKPRAKSGEASKRVNDDAGGQIVKNIATEIEADTGASEEKEYIYVTMAAMPQKYFGGDVAGIIGAAAGGAAFLMTGLLILAVVLYNKFSGSKPNASDAADPSEKDKLISNASSIHSSRAQAVVSQVPSLATVDDLNVPRKTSKPGLVITSINSGHLNPKAPNAPIESGLSVGQASVMLHSAPAFTDTGKMNTYIGQ